MTTAVHPLRDRNGLSLQPIAPIEQTASTRTERFLTGVILFYASGAVGPPLFGGNSPTDPAPIRPLELCIKIAFYCVACALISYNLRPWLRGVWNIKWVLLPVALCLASIAWSQFPGLTVRGSAVLTASTLFGVYVGVRYSVREQLNILAWVLGVGIWMSFAFVIILPDYGINHDVTPGAWQGAFAQKNNFAQIMVLAILVFGFWRPESRSWVRWVAVCVSAALLLLSRSATGIVVCVAILSAIPLFKLIRGRFTVVIPLAIGACLVLVSILLVASANSDAVLGLLHRSPDLTGRTELWSAVLYSISKRPWLGFGFSAFWEGMKGESETVLDAVGWNAWYSHDGFLDVLVQIGVAGLALWIVGYIILWRRAIRFAAKSAGTAALWLCTYLLFILLYNITEGSILSQNGIYWILYIAVASSLYPLSRQPERRTMNRPAVECEPGAY